MQTQTGSCWYETRETAEKLSAARLAGELSERSTHQECRGSCLRGDQTPGGHGDRRHLTWKQLWGCGETGSGDLEREQFLGELRLYILLEPKAYRQPPPTTVGGLPSEGGFELSACKNCSAQSSACTKYFVCEQNILTSQKKIPKGKTVFTFSRSCVLHLSPTWSSWSSWITSNQKWTGLFPEWSGLKGEVSQNIYGAIRWSLGTSRKRHSQDRVYYVFKKISLNTRLEVIGRGQRREVKRKISKIFQSWQTFIFITRLAFLYLFPELHV